MWETCDAEYEIYLEKHDDKLLSIKIYETNDALGLDEVLKFNSCTYLYEFAKQVLTEMDKLVIFYGFQGYYDRWSEDFPVSSYLNLKSYVLINSKNGIFTKSVPNLNLPFKLELKLLNTLSAVKSDEKKCENIRNSG